MVDPLRIPEDPKLSGRRCAECGSDRITASQPGIGGWPTAACFGCGVARDRDNSGVFVTEPTRVATYVACTLGSGSRLELGERIAIPCLLPDRHEGDHSPKFIPLAPKTRGPIKGVGRKGQPSKLGAAYGGSFTDLVPGWKPKEHAE